MDLDEELEDVTNDDYNYRYASTTCEVAVMQNNSGALIAVEPDHRVWAAAEVSLVTFQDVISFHFSSIS